MTTHQPSVGRQLFRLMNMATLALLLLIAAAGSNAAQSTDRDAPTPLNLDELKDDFSDADPEYFYSFTAGPGEVIFTLDVKGTSGYGGTPYFFLYNTDGKQLDSFNQIVDGSSSEKLVKRMSFARPQTIVMRIGKHLGKGYYRLRIGGAVKLGKAAPANASAIVGSRKQGGVRIGVAMPRTQLLQTTNDSNLARAVRNTFIDYLKGPSVEIVPLDSRLETQAEAEARDRQCDFILYSSVAQKKGGGGGLLGRTLGNVAGAAAGNIPYGSNAGEAAARAAATSAVYNAAYIAGTIKAKDEVSFQYKLYGMNNASPRLTQMLKAKARQDGEDVLSPLIEQAARATLIEATKKQ